MTKLDSDQYPRAEKTMMLILPDTVFIRAVNISFKQFTKLAPGHILHPVAASLTPSSLRLLFFPYALPPWPTAFSCSQQEHPKSCPQPRACGQHAACNTLHAAPGEKNNELLSVIQAKRDCCPRCHTPFRGQQWLQIPALVYPQAQATERCCAVC